MKKKLGHMDAELYPPGQNPGYFNPWVTMPYPTTPAPNTPQYGGPWPMAIPRKEQPHHIQYGGWVQVELTNKNDAERSTLADKLQGPKWYYGQLDGWYLYFYEIGPDYARRRVSSIDLRLVRRTQTASRWSLGHVVILILESGNFEFTVSEEEAEAWCAAITAAILAWSQLRAESQHSQASQPNAPTTSPQTLPWSSSPGVDPRRMHLRHSWAACVKAVSQGHPAPAEAFEDIFMLYDSDGNESLSLQEIRAMLMDLLEVRKAEVERALERQLQNRNADTLDFATQSRLKDAARSASALGKDLLSDYTNRLNAQGFERRCLLLQSQLDLSADRRVALPEFLAAAPQVLLPESELKVEANFYRSVSLVLKLAQKAQFFSAQGDAECDSGICVHQ
eukprot:Skav206159  [mRNA]  locus=scaffold1545:178079:179257:- [translate_table: standard]